MLLFGSPLDDEREFISAASSISPTLDQTFIHEPSKSTQPSTKWANGFNDANVWEGVGHGDFDNAECPEHDRNRKSRYSSPEVVSLNRELKGRQLKKGDLTRVSLSSTSNRSKSSSYDSKLKPKVRVRTRRPPQKPMKGLNPHGRSGKPRCELCRRHRQGVRTR